MFYTDLDKLQGLNSPTDYGSGVEFANGIISVFPDSKIGLQVSFECASCRRVCVCVYVYVCVCVYKTLLI